MTFSLQDCLEIFRELNLPIEKIRLGGGGAKSALLRQIQADIYGQTVETITAEEGAAFSAALLAGVDTGAWNSVDEACQNSIVGDYNPRFIQSFFIKTTSVRAKD